MDATSRWQHPFGTRPAGDVDDLGECPDPGEIAHDTLGARLEATLEAAADGRDLAETEQEFVDASQRHRDAEIVAAERADAEAERAEAEAERADADAAAARAAARESAVAALVSRVGSTRATQRDTAALLAVEAFRLADTPETRSALLATFTDDRPPLDTHRYDNEFPQPGIVMPDGVTAFQGDDGLVRDLDLDTGVRGNALPPAGDDLGTAPRVVVTLMRDVGDLTIAEDAHRTPSSRRRRGGPPMGSPSDRAPGWSRPANAKPSIRSAECSDSRIVFPRWPTARLSTLTAPSRLTSTSTASRHSMINSRSWSDVATLPSPRRHRSR